MMPMRCGGHSATRPPTEKERAFLTSVAVQSLIHQGVAGISSSEIVLLDPIQLTTQVVAGINYQVKFHVVVVVKDQSKNAESLSSSSSSSSFYVHAKIFEPLSCNPGPPELLGFVNRCTLDDPIVFTK
jgi:hypothetical protein